MVLQAFWHGEDKGYWMKDGTSRTLAPAWWNLDRGHRVKDSRTMEWTMDRGLRTEDRGGTEDRGWMIKNLYGHYIIKLICVML